VMVMIHDVVIIYDKKGDDVACCYANTCKLGINRVLMIM